MLWWRLLYLYLSENQTDLSHYGLSHLLLLTIRFVSTLKVLMLWWRLLYLYLSENQTDLSHYGLSHLLLLTIRFVSTLISTFAACSNRLIVLKSLHSVAFGFFSNDTYLIVCDSNNHTIPKELQHISEWATRHNLKLNQTKSKEIVLSLNKTPVSAATCLTRV